MTNYFDPGPGWRRLDPHEETHRPQQRTLTEHDAEGAFVAYWVRNKPVPPLPSDPARPASLEYVQGVRDALDVIAAGLKEHGNVDPEDIFQARVKFYGGEEPVPPLLTEEADLQASPLEQAAVRTPMEIRADGYGKGWKQGVIAMEEWMLEQGLDRQKVHRVAVELMHRPMAEHDRREYKKKWAVPPLPTEPRTSVKLMYTLAQQEERERTAEDWVLLDNGLQWMSDGCEFRTADTLQTWITGFEVLARPAGDYAYDRVTAMEQVRRETAKAVLDFITISLRQRHIQAHGLYDVLSNARREFDASSQEPMADSGVQS